MLSFIETYRDIQDNFLLVVFVLIFLNNYARTWTNADKILVLRRLNALEIDVTITLDRLGISLLLAATRDRRYLARFPIVVPEFPLFHLLKIPADSSGVSMETDGALPSRVVASKFYFQVPRRRRAATPRFPSFRRQRRCA